MNGWTRIAVVATWLLVNIGVTGWADTTATHIKIKGDTAVATFEAFDPDDACLENFVTVVASDRMEKVSPGGGPTSTVEPVLVVGQVDVCLGITLFSGEGVTGDPLFPFAIEFQFASNLSSATLRAMVQVFDSVSATAYPFDVEVTWTATGAPVSHHDKETFRDKDLGLMIVTDLRGRHAPAVATGTVVGLGYNFTPEPSISAELQTDNNGTISIEMTQ
jgi:hypothetical protein